MLKKSNVFIHYIIRTKRKMLHNSHSGKFNKKYEIFAIFAELIYRHLLL